MDEEKGIPMGMPAALASPTTVFPRTFRFLFIPKKNPDLQYLVNKVTLDFYQHQFDAFVLETAPGLTSQEWVIAMEEDKEYRDDYTLVALDGCGKTLYTLEFTNVKAIWHSVEYDYAKSDAVTHHVGFEYEKMKRLKPTPKPAS